MKKISLFLGLVMSCMFNAQVKFEKGYFITNSGQKNEVLIKDLDWKNNPTEFEYKTEENSQVKKETIKNVQEFGYGTDAKFIRKTVMIDNSSELLDQITYENKPEFKEETLFLKYLIEGKANLFYYEKSNIKKFFFNVDGSEIKQLIYKPYYIGASQIAYNKDYQNQIKSSLNCGLEQKEIQKTGYYKKDLATLFNKYNNCNNSSNDNSSSTINYAVKKEKEDLINITIRPGINLSSAKVNFVPNTIMIESEETKFDNKLGFRAGVEFEVIFPFNKNKWSFFAEPTYQYYKSEMESIKYPGTSSEQVNKKSIDYKSIEFPIGIRHYFFLNNTSKIFVNAGYIFDFKLNSNIKYNNFDLDVNSGNNLFIGAGYKYNDKLGIEFRLGGSRTLTRNQVSWDSNYKTMSLIFGYTIL